MAATAVANSGLEQLHEILLPDPVSWMPQTTGWYAVLALVLCIVARWIYGRVRRYRANRYRRLALAELAIIERELRQPERRAQALAHIPVVLKRTALAAFPRRDVAGLSGEQWLAFLDQTMGGKHFTAGGGRLLADVAYAPASRIAALPDASVGALLQCARNWITTHVAVMPNKG
jgi:uncharacterized protein DUF4381